MALFDLPLEQLKIYRPERSEPVDFDTFWQQTLDGARQYPLNAVFEPVDTGMSLIDVWDVTFAGYSGQPIKGWYLRPAGTSSPLPCVVEFIGYGGGRGYPVEWLAWPAIGYATFIMDTRGQGTAWRKGDTPDIPDGANPHYPGFMTQGILSPETYYYRRVFTDAARAIEAARSREDVDSQRIALTGGSQGGGITIAAAALVPDVQAMLPDVPFLCHFRRAIDLVNTYPYHEIVHFLRQHRTSEAQVLATLDYFDGVNFASRIRARALFSTGLMDEVCPPSTVFAAYNWLDSEKAITVYKYNQHEGGGTAHFLAKQAFLRDLWNHAE
jgi:cephalosporin-C deacetylase